MTVHINLSDGKSYLLSIADAIETLSDEAGFQLGDQARITCGDLRLPSGETVVLTGLLFERGNRHLYSVWLQTSKICRARCQSELLDLETAELADAIVNIDGNVTLIDGRVIRAVQINPAKLPYAISDRDWQIVHAAISAAKAEHCSYTIPLPANPEQIAEARKLNLIDYTALLSIKAPYLKVIQGNFLRANPGISSLSAQKISDTLSKFGIRHKRARPRRATI
jgi:hypothetical protein